MTKQKKQEISLNTGMNRVNIRFHLVDAVSNFGEIRTHTVNSCAYIYLPSLVYIIIVVFFCGRFLQRNIE